MGKEGMCESGGKSAEEGCSMRNQRYQNAGKLKWYA